MQQLNVLFITTWYPNHRQANEGVFVREHAKAVQHYDRVTVLYAAGHLRPDQSGLWRLVEEKDPILTEGVPTYHLYHRRVPVPGVSYLIQAWSHLRAFQQLYPRRNRPQVIHAHIYKAGVFATLIGKLYKIPVIITEHSSVFPRHLLSAYEALLARFAFRRAHHVLPVSNALQQGIESYGIQARFTVTPNVVNTQIFVPTEKAANSHTVSDARKRLLYVGSFVEVKGIPYLIEALALLTKERTDWQLDMIGRGPLMAEYQQMVQQLHLDENIIFHGFKPKDEIAHSMQQADLFVLPSVWDNMPCVLLEAMASGLPIVSTKVGGIPEIVDEETGLLVAPRNPQELCDALAHMLAHLDEYDRKQIAHKAERYDYATVGASIHEIYESVCNEPLHKFA